MGVGRQRGSQHGSDVKKIIFLAAPVVVLLLLGAGLWFTGILPSMLGMESKEHHHEAEAAKAPVPGFVEMPDIVTNLNSAQTKPSFVKMTARLEIAKQEDIPKVQAVLPRLQDMIQTYLREMRPDELRGSAGTYRLREELLARANVAAAPVAIKDVLFVQILIQ